MYILFLSYQQKYDLTTYDSISTVVTVMIGISMDNIYIIKDIMDINIIIHLHPMGPLVVSTVSALKFWDPPTWHYHSDWPNLEHQIHPRWDCRHQKVHHWYIWGQFIMQIISRDKTLKIKKQIGWHFHDDLHIISTESYKF